MRRPPSVAWLVLAVIPLLAACGSDSTAPDMTTAVTLVAADRDGDVYTINETTGAATLVINTTTQNATGTLVDVGVVSSMLWVESTQRWWLGTGGNAECDGCIQTLNVSTGVATTLIQPGNNGISGLAIHPTTGAIYSWESDSTNELYSFDPVTGVPDTLFTGLPMPSSGTGTTFSTGGTLYVAADEELWTINLTTGAPAMIGQMTFTGFPAFNSTSLTVGSMATRPSDGVVFGVLKDGGGVNSTVVTYLVRVNLTTAEITNVGPQTELMDGLAYVPTSVLP
ncbi:MAG: hypothetical protein OEO79_15335 [Gemmatimonadota bacterium]|nr:hypothetical protein [Gemmatimonadota bacterium]MDH3421627.1 hypothetical protein [Gemmatimonadota bacterium]